MRFSKNIWFLDLNLVPKGPPRGHLGRPLFHDFRRWKCSRYNEIWPILICGFEHRHGFWWFPSVFFVNPWGDFALNTKLIFTISFWRPSERTIFWMPKREFWDPNFGTPRAQKYFKKRWNFDDFDFVNRSILWWCFRKVSKTRFWNNAY